MRNFSGASGTPVELFLRGIGLLSPNTVLAMKHFSG